MGTTHLPQLCQKFHRASELIGRRWTGAIIYLLLKERCRFATLRDAIPDITDRMLSDRLQELEREGIDMPRLSASLRKVIQRHDMLRAVIQSDGTQRILPQVPDYDIAVTDLTRLGPAEQEAQIARLRTELGHQVLPADTWPLFDIRVSLLGDNLMRLHVSLDLLIADVQMPGIDGIALAERCLALSPKVRVILISGFADALDRAEHLKSKVARVVAKPVTLEGMRAAVRAALN